MKLSSQLTDYFDGNSDIDVRVWLKGGDSGFTSYIDLVELNYQDFDGTAPGDVTNFAATDDVAGQISLSWTNPADGAHTTPQRGIREIITVSGLAM